jgi:hypothetical protein
MINRSLFSSEQVSQLSIPARLTFVGIIVTSDDHGRRSAGAHALRADIFPCDPSVTNDQVAAWRDELADAGLIRLYSDAGREVLDLPTFRRWQKLRYHSKSKIAEHPDGSGNLSGLAEDCPNQSDFAEKRSEEKRSEEKTTSTSRSRAKRAPGGESSTSKETDRDRHIKAFVDWWEKLAGENGLPIPRKIPDRREAEIAARCEELIADNDGAPDPLAAGLEALGGKIAASDFLCGRVPRGFKADIDFVIRGPDAPKGGMLKIMEGRYDNSGKSGGGPELPLYPKKGEKDAG